MRIFATTVPAFLPREKPISRNANPACMNITRQPAMITHIVLIPTEGSSLPAIDLSRSVASASAEPGTASSSGGGCDEGPADRVLPSHPITLLAGPSRVRRRG